MLNRLREIFSETLQKWEGELIEFNGEADHVHLLMSVNPKVQPSKLVNNLKTVSSRLMSTWARFIESRSSGAVRTASLPLSVLTQYIQQQAEIE